MLRAALITTALAALIGGCGLTPVEPDGGAPGTDGGIDDTDAELPTSVLQFVFTSSPKVPGDAGGRDDVKIDTFAVGLEDIRAISDNASPSIPRLALDWGGAYTQDKILLDFDDAPPGIYSRLRAQIDGISITGTVVVDEQVYDYIVGGEPQSASIAVELSTVMLSGTSMTSVPIDIEVKDVIRGINWTALAALANDNLIILPADLMDDFAAALADAFEQDD